MKRIEVTRAIVGPCHMQVCAESDVTDAEILAVCNSENPSGTQNGWSHVHRADSEWLGGPFKSGPVPCTAHPGRTHFLVAC